MSTPTLDTILRAVRDGVTERKQSAALGELKARAAAVERRSFLGALQQQNPAVIAEIKRASPSAGPIRPNLDVSDLAREYEQAGASALSVLTCSAHFEGSPCDLTTARGACSLPALAKDFMLLPFQLLEAAAAGADAVLLIAAALDDLQLADMAAVAADLNMEVLFEAHDAAELDRVLALQPRLIGVNTRNLKTMSVDPATALELGAAIPASVLGVFESGVRTGSDLRIALDAGYSAALIGESLLRATQPGAALREILSTSGPT